MNGYETDEMEGLGDLFEDLESDESDESDLMERSRRGRRFRKAPRTAGGSSPYRPPSQGNYVTQTQLQSALAGVAKEVKMNSEAIKAVNARVATVDKDIVSLNAGMKKEAAKQSKEMAKLKNNIQMAMLLPMMMQPTPVTVTQNDCGIPIGTKLATAGDNLSLMLPLLMLGGMGGVGAGDDSSNMLMLALTLGMNK